MESAPQSPSSCILSPGRWPTTPLSQQEIRARSSLAALYLADPWRALLKLFLYVNPECACLCELHNPMRRNNTPHFVTSCPDTCLQVSPSATLKWNTCEPQSVRWTVRDCTCGHEVNLSVNRKLCAHIIVLEKIFVKQKTWKGTVLWTDTGDYPFWINIYIFEFEYLHISEFCYYNSFITDVFGGALLHVGLWSSETQLWSEC